MGVVWHKTPIKELCDVTSSKRIYVADYQANGVPFYRGKEIIEKYKGNTDVSTELFIAMEKFLEIERKFGVPQRNDLLLTSVGTLGIPYVVGTGEKFYFKDGNLTWFKNFKNLNSRFLYYWLLSPQGKAELKKCTIGSSQPAFTIVLLKDMHIELPSLSIQRKIASILSAYDNLIENNLRRIKILEEMAKTIYDEWFVKFHFPGHEKVKMVESELGLIPEGWTRKAVRELVNRLGFGKTYTQKEVSEVGYVPVVDQSKEEYLGFHNDEPSHYASKNEPIIIFGDHTCKMALMVESFSLGPNVVPFVSINDTNIYFLYYTVNSLVETREYKRHWNELIVKPVLVPTSQLQITFADTVKPMIANINLLRKKNINLRQTRDLLLPKLINGEIDVENLDIKIEE